MENFIHALLCLTNLPPSKHFNYLESMSLITRKVSSTKLISEISLTFSKISKTEYFFYSLQLDQPQKLPALRSQNPNPKLKMNSNSQSTILLNQLKPTYLTQQVFTRLKSLTNHIAITIYLQLKRQEIMEVFHHFYLSPICCRCAVRKIIFIAQLQINTYSSSDLYFRIKQTLL